MHEKRTETITAFKWRTIPLNHETVEKFIASSTENAAPQPLPVISLDSRVADGELYDSDGALSDSNDDVQMSE